MNNNEPDTLPDPAIGYIFQNDIVALKQAFSLPDIDYADISQREQLAAALKRWQHRNLQKLKSFTKMLSSRQSTPQKELSKSKTNSFSQIWVNTSFIGANAPTKE